MNQLSLGEKIKFFRTRLKVSQFSLEIIIGASAGSICRIESGKVNPTKETLFEIAKALNLNQEEITYLFGISETFQENKQNLLQTRNLIQSI